VVAVHFSSPYNELTNKQLRGHCKECNKRQVGSKKIIPLIQIFFKINTTDLFLKGAFGKDITTKFRENTKTLALCYDIFFSSPHNPKGNYKLPSINLEDHTLL